MYSVKKLGFAGLKLVKDPSTINSSAILIEAVLVHPLGEVAVTEYDPAILTSTEELVSPVFHTQVVPVTFELATNSTLPSTAQ